MVGVDVPIIPMAHEYLFTEPIEGVHAGLPQLRDPDNLVYFREEVGGLCMGGYERHPAPWALDGVPPDFNGKLLAPDWPRFEEIMDGAVRRVPAIADAGINRMINGPEGVHARTTSSSWARSRGPRVLRGRRVLRPRHRRRGRHRPADGDLDRRGRARARPLEDGHPPVRAGLPEPGATRSRGRPRSTRPTTTSTTRTRSAGPAARCGPRRPTRPCAALGAAFGEKSGWERPNWFESNAAAGDEALRPRGWAGDALVARDRRRGARDPARRPACSTRPRSRSSRSPGRARRRSSAGCARTTSTGRSARSSTPSSSTGAAGSRRDLTVTRLARRPLPARHRAPRSATTTPPGCAGTCPTTGRCRCATSPSGRVCFGLWGPRARDILASAHARRRLRRRVPVPHRARDHRRVRAGARPAGHLCRRARLGAVRPDGVRPGAVDDAVGGRAAARAWSPPATGRSTRSGSRRATASGRATSPRTRRPYEAGLGFAVALDKEPEFLGRDALVAAKAAGPRKRLRCLVLDDPRSVCLGNEPVRVGGEIVGRVTSGGYGFAVERSIAYAYLPPDRAAIGTRGEVEVFGEWIGFEVAREPLYDPAGERIRA